MSMIHDNVLNYTTLYTRKSQKLDPDDLHFRKLNYFGTMLTSETHKMKDNSHSNVIIVLWWCVCAFSGWWCWGLGLGLGWGGFLCSYVGGCGVGRWLWCCCFLHNSARSVESPANNKLSQHSSLGLLSETKSIQHGEIQSNTSQSAHSK